MNSASSEGSRPAGGIRGLILDYGEVLCNRPAPAMIERMARAAGLDPATFATRYHQERGLYDRGDVSPRDYWSRVVADPAALSDELVNRLRQWDVEMWSDLNGAMIEWLYEVHAAGFKTAVLSNMHGDMALHVRRSYGWLRYLDCVILSCEVRLIKPDPAIYERCLEGLGLRPFEACFIDDREVNVQAARDCGLTALQFHTVDSLRNDLQEIGVPVLPRAGLGQPKREAAGE